MTYTKDEKLQIANTILNQLGGTGKLKATIGINNTLALDSGLQFSFKGSRKMNRCTVELNSMDHDIKFYKIPTLRTNCTSAALDKYFANIEKCKIPVAQFNNQYSDMLIKTFEQTTGLYLHF